MESSPYLSPIRSSSSSITSSQLPLEISVVGESDMDKELVALYEAAEKAADAAASDDGGSSEECLCLDALRDLKQFPVNYKILVETQVGKRLRHLTKHPRKNIQAFAAELIEMWKKMIIEETSRNQKNGNSHKDASNRPISVKTENSSRCNPAKRDKSEQTLSPRPEKKVKSTACDMGRPSGAVAVGSRVPKKFETDKVETSKQETQSKPVSNTNGPPNSTDTVKSNDQSRENVQKILCEALSKVPSEADESTRAELESLDPVRVALTLESVMFEKWGGSTGLQKAKYRSIIFNLKDAKNPDFRRRVLLGQVKAEDVPTLTPEDMASDQRKKENQQIKEKALFECERGAVPQASTDQFKCGRCKQRQCTYYQMQTRSADEPMTTFVTCVNCGNRWKFC